MCILSEALSKMFPARARKALKPGVILAVLLLGPLGTLIVYSALDPYFTWYFRDFHSQIIVDGKPSQGRVHRDHSGGSLFVTRTDVHEAMTYMIIIAPETRGHVWSCGDWVAPRFPIFGIGDVNPPCWIFSNPSDAKPEPVHPPSNLVTGSNFVEFTAYDGRRVRASW